MIAGDKCPNTNTPASLFLAMVHSSNNPCEQSSTGLCWSMNVTLWSKVTPWQCEDISHSFIVGSAPSAYIHDPPT